MRSAYMLLVLLLLVYAPVFAQKQGKEKIDSLFAVLGQTKDDTSKVTLLNLIANELRNNEPDSAIYFAELALELSRKLNYIYGVAFSKTTAASAKINLGQVDEALEYQSQ